MMYRIVAYMATSSYRPDAVNNGADIEQVAVFRTEPIALTLKVFVAVVNRAAKMFNSNSIYNYT